MIPALFRFLEVVVVCGTLVAIVTLFVMRKKENDDE